MLELEVPTIHTFLENEGRGPLCECLNGENWQPSSKTKKDGEL